MADPEFSVLLTGVSDRRVDVVRGVRNWAGGSRAL